MRKFARGPEPGIRTSLSVTVRKEGVALCLNVVGLMSRNSHISGEDETASVNV